nr:hypothetical protein [Bacillaceae bacterium]
MPARSAGRTAAKGRFDRKDRLSIRNGEAFFPGNTGRASRTAARGFSGAFRRGGRFPFWLRFAPSSRNGSFSDDRRPDFAGMGEPYKRGPCA